MIKLNNSLNPNSKDLTELVKHPDKPITMYSCGPTTYDHAHIGNLRSFIMDDLLRRTIVATYGRESLNAIMNITDIDDKTIHRSIEEYPELAKTDPKAALKKLTDKYEKLFFDDLEAVGVDRSLFTVVRATEQLPQMQEMIKQIHANGFAYISDGSVYFDVAAYIKAGNKYGLLAHIDPSHQKSRIDNDEYEKQEAQDFVLWKGERDNEPAWDFKLDGQNLPGRPGWHIECSAMSAALGNPFDIHTGGIDLKFPHHENEIAQTKAATGKDMVNIFVHWNHLLVDGKKMSKSAKNFYRLSDITEKGFSPLAFRLLTLQAHYSSELNFTWESLEASQNRLLDLRAQADIRFQGETIDNSAANKATIESLASDLDTPNLLAQPKLDSEIIGLKLLESSDITAAQKALIAKRQAARDSKDFAESDKLRDQLLADNLEIDDTPNGPRWRRTKV